MVSSVVYKQVKKFRNTLKDEIDIVDLNYRGIDKNGSITVRDGQCVIDAFQVWLLSDTNDYHRNPEKGGFITKYVVKKPFADSSCESIRAQLLVEAEKVFPTLEIERCEVKCNYQTRKWEIRIAAYDRISQAVSDNITAAIPAQL